jgi:dihydroorotase
MIQIRNAQTVDGKEINHEIASNENSIINAAGLTLFPGLIDPHVHFRTPGMEHKENWRTAAQAAIYGGYTTVFDMPNTIPPIVTAELLHEKKTLIDQQLQEIGIPLRYQLFFGADKNHLNEIPKVKNAIVGIKVFMGCSTGNLVIDDDESLHAVFALAAKENLLVAVHAEDEELMRERKALLLRNNSTQSYSIHSQIRNPEVAARAVEKAISLVKQYGTRLYILHTSTIDELALIKQAKQQNLPVYAEVCPHHLFLNESAYAQWCGKAVMNPPLRAEQHQAALFQAIHDGVIDTVGSDHAPHTLGEKDQPYGCCPSGVPGIETTLPLLLNTHHQGLLSLTEIINLTSLHAQKIFNLEINDDVVLVDLNKQKTVTDQQLKTKCGWSPYTGRTLRGWPVYTILNGKIFELKNM